MVVEKCDTRQCFVSLSFYPFVKSHVEFLIPNYSLLIGKFANFPYLCHDIYPSPTIGVCGVRFVIGGLCFLNYLKYSLVDSVWAWHPR